MDDSLSANASYELYVDLLKRGVMNVFQPDQPEIMDDRENFIPNECLPEISFGMIRRRRRNLDDVYVGRDKYPGAKTMIGRMRLDNLQSQVERIVSQEIPGDFLEAGVWRGGACIVIKGLLKALGDAERSVYLADSFAGFRSAEESRYEIDGDHPFHERNATLAASRETVERNFRMFGLMDENVRFIEGWFSESLKDLERPTELSLLRLDGDLYESHIDALNALYDRVVPGGVVICDDYNALRPAHQAIDDFRRDRKITAPMTETDWAEVWWIKE